MRARWAHVRAAVTGRVSAAKVAVRYAGGEHSRIVSRWFTELADPNTELRLKLPELRGRSRDLVRDNGEAAGLLLDFESDIVGPKGALLQFRAKTAREKERAFLSARVEALWRSWGKRATCTLAGYEDWPALQRLMIRTVIVDGEFLARRVRDPRLPYGYALQPIDADQLDETHNVSTDAQGVTITMGVETDRKGRPIAYHVFDRHPTLVGRTRTRVPADEILHVFKRLRVGQVRGVPWFAPALITWKLGDRYTEAELYQSMLAAAQGGFFVNKGEGVGIPLPKAINKETGKEEVVPIVMQAEPGTARILPDGYEFQPWQPTHPTANYVGFMKAVKRICARAFGRSYATLTGDLSDVNFSSMRTDRVRETDQNKLHQADILVSQFCDEVLADFLSMQLMLGALGSVVETARELMGFVTWMCRKWPWIDPLKDAAALKLALEMRITSPQIACADTGVDFFEIIDQWAEAEAYALEKKVSMAAVGMAITVQANDAEHANGDESTPPARGVMPLRISA